MANMLLFLLKNVSFAFAKTSHIFSAKIPVNQILYLLEQLTLKVPITTIVVCFVICFWLCKSFLQTVWTQIRLLLSEQSDLGTHCLPVCKNRFEKFARIFSRRHKQTTFSESGFLSALRVNKETINKELVSLTMMMIWTTEPWYFISPSNLCCSSH